ncbi:hypothetical protein SRIMM317S_05077 [Streptomyces rimosus subsp. rimosus]
MRGAPRADRARTSRGSQPAGPFEDAAEERLRQAEVTPLDELDVRPRAPEDLGVPPGAPELARGDGGDDVARRLVIAVDGEPSDQLFGESGRAVRVTDEMRQAAGVQHVQQLRVACQRVRQVSGVARAAAPSAEPGLQQYDIGTSLGQPQRRRYAGVTAPDHGDVARELPFQHRREVAGPVGPAAERRVRHAGEAGPARCNVVHVDPGFPFCVQKMAAPYRAGRIFTTCVTENGDRGRPRHGHGTVLPVGVPRLGKAGPVRGCSGRSNRRPWRPPSCGRCEYYGAAAYRLRAVRPATPVTADAVRAEQDRFSRPP